MQVRVGAVVLTVETGGLDAERRSDGQLTELAGMFAERARQIQNGKSPTARIG
ncbi:MULTISPECIES: hypothetical protein [Streptomyces]|uniref:hypothetical protein n=1 Tax=Streptomyces TaxID=1883 RepID=UPI001294B72C|nr:MULTISPECIES: hypothetical protein [Streptomyces]